MVSMKQPVPVSCLWVSYLLKLYLFQVDIQYEQMIGKSRMSQIRFMWIQYNFKVAGNLIILPLLL